jgi:hypothetical protein
MTPERDPEQPPRGVSDLAGSGQRRDRLGVGGAEQPDAAVGGRGDPVPLVLAGGQAGPRLREVRSLVGIVGA